jgi:hypothetical protein
LKETIGNVSFVTQIAIHRYRELQNYLQIYTCTITVTEKQKWTQGLSRSTHTFIYDVSVTQIPLEMNIIIFYNVDTLSTTVRTSSQVTLEIGQMFLFKI